MMTNLQGTNAALSGTDRHHLLDIIGRLQSQPTTVDDKQLATARNLAARAGFHRTQLALEQEIHRRGDGALDPDGLADLAASLPPSAYARASIHGAAQNVAAVTPPPPGAGKPLWPFILGTGLFLGVLSHYGRKGHHEAVARVDRDRARRGLKPVYNIKGI